MRENLIVIRITIHSYDPAVGEEGVPCRFLIRRFSINQRCTSELALIPIYDEFPTPIRSAEVWRDDFRKKEFSA